MAISTVVSRMKPIVYNIKKDSKKNYNPHKSPLIRTPYHVEVIEKLKTLKIFSLEDAKKKFPEIKNIKKFLLSNAIKEINGSYPKTYTVNSNWLDPPSKKKQIGKEIYNQLFDLKIFPFSDIKNISRNEFVALVKRGEVVKHHKRGMVVHWQLNDEITQSIFKQRDKKIKQITKKNEYMRKYRISSHDKVIESQTKWRNANRDKFNQVNREYYRKNKSKILEKSRKYRDNNLEIIRERKREYRQKNKEKIKADCKIYREKNKDRLNKKRRINRSLKKYSQKTNS